jgi:hypothetical protein
VLYTEPKWAQPARRLNRSPLGVNIWRNIMYQLYSRGFNHLSLLIILAIIPLSGCEPTMKTEPSITSNSENIISLETITRTVIDQNITSTPIIIENTPNTGELSVTGPWLVYEGKENGSLNITDLETNPAIHIDINISQGRFPVSGSISNGLFAVISEQYFENEKRPRPILLIIKLPTLEIISRIALLSNPDIEIIDGQFCNTCESVRIPPQWSPDGKYLAFVGAIDGPSGDLYVYAADTTKIIRLTDGINQIGEYWWSPDSKWIIHEEVDNLNYGQINSIWAAKYDGSDVKWLYSPKRKDEQEIAGWTRSYSFISYDHSMDGMCQIRYTNITTTESLVLYKGCIWNLGIDPKTETLAFIPITTDAYLTNQEEFIESLIKEENVVILSLDDLRMRIIIPKVNSDYIMWDSVNNLFITKEPCENIPKDVKVFTVKGELSCLPFTETFPSPNNNLRVQVDPIVILYNQLGEEIAKKDIAGKYKIIDWLPDSRGFLLQNNDEIFYFSVPILTEYKLVNGPDLYKNKYNWVYKVE